MTESARPQSIDDFYRLLDPQLTVTLSAEELQHVPVSPAAASTRPPAKPKKKTLSALQALILLVMAFAGFMYLMITKPFSGSSAVAEQPVVENPQPQIAVKPDKKEMIPQPQFQSKRQAVVKQEVAQEVRIEEIAKGPGVSDPTKPYRPEQESLAPPASGNASRLPVSGLPAVGGNGSRPKPPEFAIRACVGKGQGAACSINAPHGMLTGECREIQGVVGCIPSGHSRPPGAR